MIVYESTHWLGMVVRVHGSVVKRIWPRFVVTTAIAAALTWLQRDPRFHMSLTVPPFVITGLPLGIILGFRNSSSYDRYWDGRKLWGALTNQCRSLVRQLHTLVDAPDGASDAQREELEALRKEVTYRLVGFVLALRLHLRREKDPALLAPYLAPEELAALSEESSPPAALLHRLGLDLRRAARSGLVDKLHVPAVDATLSALTDVVGGCERIKNTPTPISYIIFIHRAVAVYAVLLPFGLVDTVHAFTPVVVFFISYAFFSLDAIGDELDDPFRRSDNALPLDTLSRNIEIFARRRLGEKDVPEPLAPVNGVLR
ncbi:MAG: bestrophin family protein [Polyangiaceae bacterium]